MSLGSSGSEQTDLRQGFTSSRGFYSDDFATRDNSLQQSTAFQLRDEDSEAQDQEGLEASAGGPVGLSASAASDASEYDSYSTSGGPTAQPRTTIAGPEVDVNYMYTYD